MMVPLLIALAWKSALLCIAALVGMAAMRGRPAAERVVLLRVTLAALLALPVLMLALPAAEVPLLPAHEAVPTELATPPPQQRAVITQPMPRAERTAGPVELAGPIYLGGVGLLLLHLLIGIVTLARWTRRGRPVADRQWLAAMARAWTGRRPVRLLISSRASMPLSWGVAPAWILIDPDTAGRPEQAESVVAHEIAHIRRFDWLALVAAHLATALFWFNPLVWLVRRQLIREAELAADSDVVREIARVDYAQVLLSVAARPAGPRVVNGMALARRALPHRIATLLEGGAHRRASRTLSVALLVCGLGATAPLAAMKLVPAASPAEPVTLRTVSMVPAPRPHGAEANPAPGETMRWAPVVREKPQVYAPPVAPTPAPPPDASVRRPGPVILAQPGKEVILLSAPQQVVVTDTAEDVRRSVEEGRRAAEEGKRQAIESRAETAAQLLEGAAEMREQAMDLEESANEEDLPAPVREGHRKAAQSMRVQAAQMESRARELLGTP